MIAGLIRPSGAQWQDVAGSHGCKEDAEALRGEGRHSCDIRIGCEEICDEFFCGGDEEKNKRKKKGPSSACRGGEEREKQVGVLSSLFSLF